MKTLLYKQVRLSAHPMSFVFPFFGVMILIPNYPYTVSFFYTTLGIFFMYMNMREMRDAAYTAILPVRKQDGVRASMLFCYLLELFSVLIALAFVFLAGKLRASADNLAGVDANLMLIGLGFLLYALFNTVYFPSFYRTGYRVGLSFVKSSLASALVVALDVILPHIPGLSFADGAICREQLFFCLGCMLLWVLLSFLALRRSIGLYEKVDL